MRIRPVCLITKLFIYDRIKAMKNIEYEISIIKNLLEKSFIDPIPNKALQLFITEGSKYIRSSFALLYLKSQNCIITDSIFNILVAGEIIHNASLLHDDVIDDANTRRGKTTISKEFSPKISILAGDFLLTTAIETILDLNNLEILNIFKNCTKKMSEAEIKQFFFRNQIPTESEYLEICEGKTALLFSSILESCAIISNLSPENAKLLGKLFGICFQINNDLNPESINSDKLNNIYTIKDIVGIENTKKLLDNYKEEMSKLIKDFPENIYKKNLEDLIKSL